MDYTGYSVSMQNTESVALCILSKPCLLEAAIVLVTS